MVLAAVLPIFFAVNDMRTEPEMEIIIVNTVREATTEDSNHVESTSSASSDEKCMNTHTSNCEKVKSFPLSLEK